MKIIKRLFEVIFMGFLIMPLYFYYSFLLVPISFIAIPLQYIIKGKWYDSSNDWPTKILSTTIFKDFVK